MKKDFAVKNLIGLPFIFLAMPIFIDIENASLLVEKNFLLDSRRVLFPLGGLIFALLMFLLYLVSIKKKSMFWVIFRPSHLLVFFVFGVLPLLVHSLFYAGLSVPRTIQLLLPLVGLSFFALPKNKSWRSSILWYLILGACMFFALHMHSLLMSESKIFDVTAIDFSFVYQNLIYQALVTYPAVLTLYMFLGVAVFLEKGRGLTLRLVALATSMLAFMLVLLAGRRSGLIEILAGTGALFALLMYRAIRYGRISKEMGLLALIVVLLSPMLLHIYEFSPLHERVSQSIESNTFDSGRLVILSKAFALFVADPMLLLFGGGGRDVPGFHNFFLDTLYRVGLIGLAWLLGAGLYLIHRYRKIFKDIGPPSPAETSFLVVILISFVSQSVVNASITQPYYALNIFAVILSINFLVYKRFDGDLSQTAIR